MPPWPFQPGCDPFVLQLHSTPDENSCVSLLPDLARFALFILVFHPKIHRTALEAEKKISPYVNLLFYWAGGVAGVGVVALRPFW